MLRVGGAGAIRWLMERDTACAGRRSLANVSIRWRPAIFFVVSLPGLWRGRWPGFATAPSSLGTQQTFVATITSTTNTALYWSVNGISGGNALVGTISPSGVYTSPVDLPASGSVTVQAISAADNSKSAISVSDLC